MKNKIKYYFYNITNFFDKKKYIYLFLGLLLINIYCILDTKNNYGIDYNLIFDFNNRYYLCMLLLLISFFVIEFLNAFKNKIELVTRFKSKQQYFNYVIKCLIFITIFIFILNFGILLFLRVIKHHFTFSTNDFYLYNIPSILYFSWQFFRNYIYILFISYIVAFLNFHISNKSIIYIVYITVIILLLIPIGSIINNNIIKIFIFSTFLSYYNFGSMLNEFSYFACSFIIKYYILYFLMFCYKKWRIYGNY